MQKLQAFQECVKILNSVEFNTCNEIIAMLKQYNSDISKGVMPEMNGIPGIPDRINKVLIGCLTQFCSFDDENIRKAIISNLESTNNSKYINEKLIRIFSPARFDIVTGFRKDGKIRAKISSARDNSHCLTLTIDLNRNNIKINGLDKCGSGTGPALLNDVYQLALSFPQINHIDLIDASGTHVCNVPTDLAVLKILTTGQSWYNAYGYYSDDHDDDVAHNKKIIDAPFVNFINIFPRELIERLKHVFPEIEITPDITFTDYVNKLLKSTGRDKECDKEKAETLAELVNYVAETLFSSNRILHYEVDLKRTIERLSHGGKRMRTKSNRISNIKGNKKSNRKSNRKGNRKSNRKGNRKSNKRIFK